MPWVALIKMTIFLYCFAPKKKLFQFSWLPADRSVKPSLAYRFSFYLCPLFPFYAPFNATTACCKCSTWMQKVFQLKSSRQWRSVVGGGGVGAKLCLVEVCLNKRTTCLMWQQQQQQQAASRATTTGGTDVHCFSFCFIIYFAFLHPPPPHQVNSRCASACDSILNPLDCTRLSRPLLWTRPCLLVLSLSRLHPHAMCALEMSWDAALSWVYKVQLKFFCNVSSSLGIGWYNMGKNCSFFMTGRVEIFIR